MLPWDLVHLQLWVPGFVAGPDACWKTSLERVRGTCEARPGLQVAPSKPGSATQVASAASLSIPTDAADGRFLACDRMRSTAPQPGTISKDDFAVPGGNRRWWAGRHGVGS